MFRKPACRLFLLIAFFISAPCLGQGENNQWMLGIGTGLSFNTTLPSLVTSSMNSSEGSATLCDAAGNLVFYSDGNVVRDKNHNIMPNGSGILGNGPAFGGVPGSSTQGVAIIPCLNNLNRYYLFTLDAAEQITGSFNPGYLRYSVIDMMLNNGLGDVVAGQKNIQLGSYMSEKMVVVKGVGCSYWLIVHHHTDKEYYAYKIDANGIGFPVVSFTGVMTSNTWGYISGDMQISPDRTKLVAVGTSDAVVEVASFDTTTGIISNAQQLDSTASAVKYGVGFSPDGSRLYIGTFGSLWQYNFSLMPNITAVKNSRMTISSSEARSFRKGPDNKLYVARGWSQGFIGVIDNPNGLGAACNYNPTAIVLPAATFPNCQLGTPIIKQPLTITTNVHDTSSCFPSPITISAPPGYLDYSWSTGATTQSINLSGPDTVWVFCMNGCDVFVDTFKFHYAPNNTFHSVKDTAICFATTYTFSAPAGFTNYQWSTGVVGQTISVSAADTFWVQYNNGCDFYVDTFKIQSAPLNINTQTTDTSICFPATITLYGASGYTNYQWSTGSNTQSYTVSAADTLWVVAANGCDVFVDTFKVQAMPVITNTSSLDTIICFPASITLSGASGFNTYQWSTGSNTPSITLSTSDTVWVVATNACDVQVDTFKVQALPTSNLSYNFDTIICFPNVFSLNAPPGYDDYLWSNASTSQTISLNTTDTVWVISTAPCAIRVDTFRIAGSITDTNYFFHDTTVCFESSVTLNAPNGYSQYAWQDGSTLAQYTATQNGLYWVASKELCIVRFDTIQVKLIHFEVDLGEDTAICPGDGMVLNAFVANAQYLWQDQSTMNLFTVTTPGIYSVEVNVDGCKKSDAIEIEERKIKVDLGADQLLCHGETYLLDATTPGCQYLWNDGSHLEKLQVTETGTYWVELSMSACRASDTVHVAYEKCDCYPFIPSAFSPNNDGRNDQFGVMLDCHPKSFEMMIFNRWGNKVFSTFNLNDRWDGTFNGERCELGTYFYFIRFIGPRLQDYQFKGDITLIR